MKHAKVFRNRSVRACHRQDILGVDVHTPCPASVQPAPNPVGLVVNPFLPPLTVLSSTAGGEQQAHQQGQYEYQLKKMALFNYLKHSLKSIFRAFLMQFLPIDKKFDKIFKFCTVWKCENRIVEAKDEYCSMQKSKLNIKNKSSKRCLSDWLYKYKLPYELSGQYNPWRQHVYICVGTKIRWIFFGPFKIAYFTPVSTT